MKCRVTQPVDTERERVNVPRQWWGNLPLSTLERRLLRTYFPPVTPNPTCPVGVRNKQGQFNNNTVQLLALWDPHQCSDMGLGRFMLRLVWRKDWEVWVIFWNCRHWGKIDLRYIQWHEVLLGNGKDLLHLAEQPITTGTDVREWGLEYCWGKGLWSREMCVCGQTPDGINEVSEWACESLQSTK